MDAAGIFFFVGVNTVLYSIHFVAVNLSLVTLGENKFQNLQTLQPKLETIS